MWTLLSVPGLGAYGKAFRADEAENGMAKSRKRFEMDTKSE